MRLVYVHHLNQPRKYLVVPKNAMLLCVVTYQDQSESAKALNTEEAIVSNAIFNEAGLPSANWHTLKLSPKIWAVTFRVLWLLGYSRNSESFKEAKERAIAAVKKLSEMAHEYESVLFVGHGVYNRILVNELRRSGWSGPKNPGSKHWSIGVYECKKHNKANACAEINSEPWDSSLKRDVVVSVTQWVSVE